MLTPYILSAFIRSYITLYITTYYFILLLRQGNAF
nr:MAG TPA: hypothetical protein [Caudoviricetes sp.]